MAKQSGLGDQLFIAGVDIGADVSQIGGLSTPRETLPATGITQLANARIFGRRDGTAEFTTYFEDTPAGTFQTLKTLPTSDVQIMYLRGTTLGNEGLCMIGKQVNYDPNRSDSGEFTFGVNVLSSGYGADWGRQLTAGKRSDTTATNGSSIDTTASAAFGWQAYLQVFSFTGTSCTVTIEDSADNAAWATLSGGGFTAATGITTQRLESASATATVRRYLRAVTTGTFSQCTFAVVITKNENTRAL